MTMNVGIIGSGVAGLAAASRLHKAGYNITVFERDHWIGGHARTIKVGDVPVDTGFMVFNSVTYPNMVSWFREHNVLIEPSDMSFGISAENGYLEWASHNITSVFAQRTNYLNPYFYAMLYDMKRFEPEVLQYLKIVDADARTHGSSSFPYPDPTSPPPSPSPAPSSLDDDYSRNNNNNNNVKKERKVVVDDVDASKLFEDIDNDNDNDNFDDNMDNNNVDKSTFDKDIKLGTWLKKNNYSSYFINYYLIPVCASVWSCPSQTALDFDALFLFRFFKNHHLLQLYARPQWMTVAGRSQQYVKKVTEGFVKNIHTNSPVTRIERSGGKVYLWANSQKYEFDHVIVATQNPAQFADSLNNNNTNNNDNTNNYSSYSSSFSPLEREILSLFKFEENKVILHQDHNFMPKNKNVWASWNFLGNSTEGVCVTYWLNLLQNTGDTDKPILVTLNPGPRKIDQSLVVDTWVTTHPIPSTAGIQRMPEIQGLGNLWYAGAYLGNGFHEDGVRTGFLAADYIIRQHFDKVKGVLPYPPHMQLSLLQRQMRSIVISYLNSFVKIGRLQILEHGGDAFVFGQKKLSLTPKTSDENNNSYNVQLYVSSPEFYNRIAMRFDLGLAEAYMDGLFEPSSLLDLFKLLIANRDSSSTTPNKAVGLTTALVGTLGSYVQHFYVNKNSVGQAQKNISDHYDLGNSFFSTFLDSTMQYSCGIFNSPNDSLQQSQVNKMRELIKKAKITKDTTVLEIGFGWGGLSILMAQEIGCKVTGITLSKEQKKYAEDLIRTKYPSIQHLINYQLVDYRKFTVDKPFDRIVSCEMLEAVGHEYLPDFFKHTDRLLNKNGIMVVQVITCPDSRYDYYRKTTDFIQKYIFPGGLCPSLSALTESMKKASTFQVETVENIGPHYAKTLELWRQNFWKNADNIRSQGFSEKFLRKWNYYFEYCEAGFATRTLSDLHIVFSRISNPVLDSN